MTASYIDNAASWYYYRTKSPLPIYRMQGDKVFSIGTIPADRLFRVYKGKVQSPWSTSWEKSPTVGVDGYYAIETAPLIKGQLWAAYEVTPGYILPTVAQQNADGSKKNRRVWAKDSEIATNAVTAVFNEGENNVMGLQKKGNVIGTSDYIIPGGGEGKGEAGKGKGKGKVTPKTTPPPKSGSNWFLWLAAAGAAVAGAPVMVPVALAAAAIATTKKT